MARKFMVTDRSNSLAIFYNKKMFSDASISSPPATWAELTDDAAKLPKLQCTDWTSLQ